MEHEEDLKQDQKPDSIEDMKVGLYSRGYTPPEAPRSPLKSIDAKVETMWKHSGSRNKEDSGIPEPVKKGGADPFFKKIFIIAIIFFLVSVGVAFAIFFWGLNVVSTDKVEVAFQGPISIAAGNELDFNIVITNNNDSTLVNPVLYIDYPDGTKHVEDLTEDLSHEKDELDSIPANTTIQKALKAVLFGEAQSIETVKVTLDYNLKGSNTMFSKQVSYQVTLSSSPLSMTFDYPTETITSSDITFKVTLTSNSTVPLSNLLFEADYPFGFTFGSSSPAASFNSNIWAIPSLSPGASKVFTIEGHLNGKEGDQPSFQFKTGPATTSNQKDIATNYLNIQKAITIQKPPIDIEVTLQGLTDAVVAASEGDKVSGAISITNNLDSQIIAPTITASFGGALLDPLSPTSQNGFYRSIDSSIVWDKTTLPDLQSLNPGQTVNVAFTLSSLTADEARSFTDGLISIGVTANGQRIGDTGIAESVSNSISRTIKIQSGIGIAARSVYSVGPFKNTGPVPPKPNIPTTYTIIWDVTTGSNAIAGADVTATLPQYVTWLGIVSPATENVTYDPLQSQITWHVGDLPPGTGSTAPIREMAFQVKMLPSTSQINSVPMLVNQVMVTGVNTFTNNQITNSGNTVTTNLDTDPNFPNNSGFISQ